MKLWFPNHSSGASLTRKQGAPWIISSVIIGFFAGLCVSYLLQNKFWLLMIVLVGIAGIFLCLGGAVIFLNRRKVDGAASANSAPGASINENGPRITSQWDYRPQKPIRASAVFDSAGAETSEVLSSDSFGINNNVWCNDNSLQGAAAAFINPEPDGEEELSMKVLSKPTDTVCTAPAADDAAVSR